MKVFSFSQDIGFRHCDPAGIVFYPRYFEMMNDAVELFSVMWLTGPSAVCTPLTGAVFQPYLRILISRHPGAWVTSLTGHCRSAGLAGQAPP